MNNISEREVFEHIQKLEIRKELWRHTYDGWCLWTFLRPMIFCLFGGEWTNWKQSVKQPRLKRIQRLITGTISGIQGMGRIALLGKETRHAKKKLLFLSPCPVI